MSQRVAIYARVSTLHNQDPEIQLAELREYAARRSSAMTAEYVGLGVTGPGMSPRVEPHACRCPRAGFDADVCWKLDRLGRSLKRLVTTIEDLSAYGVTFISLRDNLDLGHASGNLMMHVIGAMAQFQRELIKERVSAGMHAARERGSRIVDRRHIRTPIRSASCVRRTFRGALSREQFGIGTGPAIQAAQNGGVASMKLPFPVSSIHPRPQSYGLTTQTLHQAEFGPIL